MIGLRRKTIPEFQQLQIGFKEITGKSTIRSLNFRKTISGFRKTNSWI
jgi:hypothetical protein